MLASVGCAGLLRLLEQRQNNGRDIWATGIKLLAHRRRGELQRALIRRSIIASRTPSKFPEMPLETRSRPSSKPLTPALSSNLRARPTQQPALTPRLATSAFSPAQSVSPTTTTIPSRLLRQRGLSPDEREIENASKLNSNITPRSGARASRLDTESPTTPDTSASERHAKGGSSGIS